MKNKKSVRSPKSEVRSPEAQPDALIDISSNEKTADCGLRTSDCRVCAVITEETVASARDAIRRAATVADIIEIRLDCLRDLDFTKIDNLRLLVENKPLPTIITCRSVSEGGRQYVDDRARLRLLVEGARRMADYCDIEAAHYEEAAKLAPDLSKLIVSYHNFIETPHDLESIYEQITRLPAAIHKIATRANAVSDSLRIFRLLERARREGKTLIALAMSEAGLMTRILGPSFGSLLTYASLERGRESAPSQITCKELIDTYRIHKITRATNITGIIGCPVSHSASPAMHNRAFAALGLDFVYLPIEVDDAARFITQFVRPATSEIELNLRGLSVTIPHKTAVMPLLDEIDDTARKVGAVNTIVLDGEKLAGFNTDVAGAIAPLEKMCPLGDESVAVIGAGGAARAVVYGLIERGARVTLFARDVMKARALAESFDVSAFPLDALASSDAQIIINTTPVGMRGHSCGESPIAREWLRGRTLAYDLIYNPLETQFLKDARAEGCAVLSGLEMLVAQAALQFRLWTGQDAPTDLMREAALKKIVA
ncbi:MAG TPA: shikimate dehydrogenase [Blastocatellia bacterium]|nr:shikimate dehydrogenase [Blastocatellia bacterium]